MCAAARILAASLAVLAVSVTTPAAAQDEAPKLTDPEIAHVAVTANSIDVELAELALEHTENESVLAFARTMITDHNAVNEQAVALAGRLGVTPKDNAVSQSLMTGAAEARSNLETLNGDSFDRAYMEREVAYHQAVLDALDGLLIPQSSNAELRALLEQVRPAIAAHLEHAKKLDSELGK